MTWEPRATAFLFRGAPSGAAEALLKVPSFLEAARGALRNGHGDGDGAPGDSPAAWQPSAGAAPASEAGAGVSLARAGGDVASGEGAPIAPLVDEELEPAAPGRALLASEVDLISSSPRRAPLENDSVERVASAVALLKRTAESLAEQARADVVDISLAIARHLVQRELKLGIEPLLAYAREAVRQIGAERNITVRLAPVDAERVIASRDVDLGAVSSVSVEVIPDAALEPGDVVIDTDLGRVDGRLGRRVEDIGHELRASLGFARGSEP